MSVDFCVPLILNPFLHTIIWPMQTLTALHRACLTERSSWIASRTPSSLETHACRCGGQEPSRPGWGLSWECPCTCVLALKTSKAARYMQRYIMSTLISCARWCCSYKRRLSDPQVLLGLTDEDLEQGLGITQPIHRRKLRLAIEDYRRAEGDQTWAASNGTLPQSWWTVVWSMFANVADIDILLK